MKSLLLAVSAAALLMCLASTPVTAQQRDGAAPAAPRRQPQLVAVCANSQSDPTTDAAGLCHRPDRRPARSVATESVGSRPAGGGDRPRAQRLHRAAIASTLPTRSCSRLGYSWPDQASLLPTRPMQPRCAPLSCESRPGMSGGIAWGSFASRCAREQAENKMRLKWQNQGGNRLVDAATRALYFIEIAGGCTRTRTLDPLIKSRCLRTSRRFPLQLDITLTA